MTNLPRKSFVLPRSPNGKGFAIKEYERFEAIAAQHRRDAQDATLDNVRERCRRSEEAWNKMAVQSRRTEQRREERARLTSVTASEAIEA